MNFREFDSKIYSVLFANNLNSIEKYEKLRDLLRESYDMGFKDGEATTDEVYRILFESNWYDGDY